MSVDFKESATRKIGPLPVWGWAIAVAGAVIGVRILRGGSAVSTGTPTVVGTTSDTTSSDGGYLADQVDALASDTAGLADQVGNVSVFSALQQQLNNALLQRVEADRQISTKRDQIANIKDLYRTGRISKKQYTTRLENRQSELQTIQAQKTTADNLITNLQKQIAGISA